MTGPLAAPRFLQAGPLRLVLRPHPQGPLPEAEGEAFESLCWILWSATHGPADSDLNEAIRSGEAWSHEIMQLRPTLAEDDLDRARAAWRRATDTELGGELRLMYVGGKDPSVVPLEVLREACAKLRTLVERYRVDPPWLFCAEPRWHAADQSEREALGELDERLAAGVTPPEEELAERGLASPAHGLQKLEHLLGWRLDSVAGLYIERLRSVDRLDLPGPPWLFARKVHFRFPHPMEALVLRELEAEAAAVEQAEQALGGSDEPVALVQRRAGLLLRLESHGLLDADHRDDKRHQLHRRQCPVLIALYQAALEAADYLRSPERARYNPGLEASDVLAGPICIDAFRSLAPPEGVSRFAWISWGEYLLRTHGPGPDVRASSGEFPFHDQDGLVWVFWRKDARVPALRHVVLQKR